MRAALLLLQLVIMLGGERALFDLGLQLAAQAGAALEATGVIGPRRRSGAWGQPR